MSRYDHHLVQVPNEQLQFSSCRKGPIPDNLLFVLQNARHIEVQIFGDGKGTVVTFPERECSIQVR